MIAALTLLGSAGATAINQDFDDVTIKPTRVADGIYMLEGRGGNIGVCAGADGVFMIDDQFAPLTDKILAAVGTISDAPVKFVVNTHWHGDHTGGNENLGEGGAVIVAHENVRKRMSSEQFTKVFDRRTPPSPKGALPVVTFADAVTFHWNDEELHVFHVAHAHTDGDSIIHMKKANVVHMGDILFNGMYPYIDVSAGGSIEGVIAAVDRVLRFCNEHTRLIPGHGPLATPDDLRRYRAMLVNARGRIGRLVADGVSRDAVVAARPTRSLDDEWGGGFMKPDMWVGLVYDGMKKRQREATRE
ncbi:MAG: MBL fold metallo-hydrolase [Planctomycetes bacterium]|nr:MBL fold metallo-hydrolase [Planctomycetota bacterium]